MAIMLSLAGKNFVAVYQPCSQCAGTGVVIPVFGAFVGPRSDFVAQAAAVKRRMGMPPSIDQQRGEERIHFSAGPFARLPNGVAVLIDQAGSAIRDIALGMGAQRRHLDFELARHEKIVAVEILDELPPCLLSPCFAREPGSSVLAGYHANLVRELLFQSSQLRQRAVRGSVVHQYDFYRPVGLLQHAPNSLANEFFPIVNGNDRRNQSFHSIFPAEVSIRSTDARNGSGKLGSSV